MKRVGMPIRLKIMMTLLVALTLVVIVITFVMANFFHDDKQSYMNDWVSMAARSTAEETRLVLDVYVERMQRYAGIMRLDAEWEDKEVLLQGLFDDFPELVHIVLIDAGEASEPVVESNLLAGAGLNAEDVAEYRQAHPVPFDQVSNGIPFVRNSSINARLPTMTLAVRADAHAAGASDTVVVAEVVLDQLLRIGADFPVFEIMLVAPDGSLLAHPDADRVAAGEQADLVAAARTVDQEHRAGITLEFDRDGTEMIGGYSGAGFGGVIVAAQIPKSAAYIASRSLLSRLTMVAAILLIVVGIGSRFWARRITRPVERLSNAIRAIARGDFEIEVDVRSRDEIGSLAGSFNQMAFELKTRDQKLETAHKQLIHSEKMSAFGQLGAGIAHEVKNPLAGILGCTQLSLLEVDEGTELHTNLEIIEKETSRCKKIIENLMRFARQEDAELKPIDVNEVVRDAVAIVRHQLQMNQVKIDAEFSSDLPLVNGNANQLQQVLMNLMINAQQAMGDERGSVTIETKSRETNEVQISVVDSGPGIPEEIQERLFEPFFTTKPTGQGTGLGLSVSYGIVQDHQGRIEVESASGEGATFTIVLPALPDGYAEIPISEALEEARPFVS